MYALGDARQTAQIRLPIGPRRDRDMYLRQGDGGDLNYTDPTGMLQPSTQVNNGENDWEQKTDGELTHIRKVK